MFYKNILVHLANDAAHMRRLKLGADLAIEFEAHLTALYIATPIHMPAAITGRGASSAFIAEATALAHEAAETLEEETRKHCHQKVDWEWRVEEGDHLKVLSHYANLTDLALVAQAAPHHLEDYIADQIPDHLALYAGCPVLVVPQEGEIPTFGERIVVAWKPHPPALQALRDSLPFLKRAKEVTVVTIEAPSAVGATDIGAYLRYHGIDFTFNSIEKGDSNAGEHLLAVAEEVKADLLVMGAFGHPRWREIVLGGTTRHVLRHMTLPVLMAH